MNRRAFMAGLAYCFAAIVFKLIILLGGYTSTKFGFYYSHIVSVLLIVPFFWIAIKQVRDKEQDGIIGGREAARIALTVLAVAIVVMTVYNYAEFAFKGKDLAIEYYHSDKYRAELEKMQARYPDKIKTGNFPKIIDEQISSLSPFKATTGKIFPLLFVGLCSAFIVSAAMKRK